MASVQQQYFNYKPIQNIKGRDELLYLGKLIKENYSSTFEIYLFQQGHTRNGSYEGVETEPAPPSTAHTAKPKPAQPTLKVTTLNKSGKDTEKTLLLSSEDEFQ